MSDPVTKGEIEDVLSSIRRLVAADSARTGAQSGAQSGAGAATARRSEPRDTARRSEPRDEEGQDRLVLSPSFRVPEDEAPEEEAPENEAQSASSDEADTDDDAYDLPPEMLRLTRALSARAAETQAGTGAGRNADTPPADTPPDPQASGEVSARRTSIEKTIAELEAAVTGQPDDWEPDGSEVDRRDAPEWDFSEERAHHGVDEFKLRSREEGPPPAAEEESDEGTEEDRSADLAALWAEAREGEAAAEDSEGAEGLRQPTFGEREALYAGGIVPGPETVEDPEEENVSAATAEEETEFLDEEMLRDLVAEIVRQELQGALGERITRNVRKLVRREIHRILQSQEFE